MDTLILNKDGQPLSMLPLSAIPWQTAVRLLSLGKVFVLEDYDNWDIHSQHITMKVPSIVMATEYVKWKNEAKFSRANVYLRDGFKCQYCKDTFPISLLTFDHVVPRSDGGKTSWGNITTACKDCNSRKGNDASIIPAVMPHRPSYYELVAKRKEHPIYISDEKWKVYLGWPEKLYKVRKHNHSYGDKND